MTNRNEIQITVQQRKNLLRQDTLAQIYYFRVYLNLFSITIKHIREFLIIYTRNFEIQGLKLSLDIEIYTNTFENYPNNLKNRYCIIATWQQAAQETYPGQPDVNEIPLAGGPIGYNCLPDIIRVYVGTGGTFYQLGKFQF